MCISVYLSKLLFSAQPIVGRAHVPADPLR